ncbi:MAG: PAS sensor protein [Acidobacteriia bacterium]|nr:PAS sensor protein [Terriglobia bacterium]
MSATAQQKVIAPKSPRPGPRVHRTTPKEFLARAFQTFTHAADSLEKSYGQLQNEVLRLRFELERTNRDLAASVEENAGMRRYLARILEGLPCGVFVVNREGEPRMANPEARRILSSAGDGFALAAETLRQSIEELRAGSPRTEKECVVETPEGTRTIGVACAVLGETEGEGFPSESVFILRDVTEERRQASERETARRKASLAELATLLAHEIRNPLGSLELFAGLLADAAALQPDLRRWTDHIQAGLRSLSATVNNVLQFHSQPELQLAEVNVGRLMRESVEFLRPLARQAGLRIDLHNALGELEIPADAHRLQQVFFNLALNAFRAMTTGGLLTIRLQWAEFDRLNEVRIDFEDTGRGIAPEHLEKIFEPGFTTQPGNPGIGLAVCRAVVEQHRGSIQVASEPGKGATLSVILPRVALSAGAAA